MFKLVVELKTKVGSRLDFKLEVLNWGLVIGKGSLELRGVKIQVLFSGRLWLRPGFIVRFRHVIS